MINLELDDIELVYLLWDDLSRPSRAHRSTTIGFRTSWAMITWSRTSLYKSKLLRTNWARTNWSINC